MIVYDKEEKKDGVDTFELLALEMFKKEHKKVVKYSNENPDKLDDVWLGLFKKLKKILNDREEIICLNGNLLNEIRALNDILNDETLLTIELTQKAIDYLENIIKGAE